VDNTTEKTKTIVKETKNKALDVAATSKTTIEKNKWLLPLKWCLHFPRHFPRTNAFIWVVILLWLLIFVSMGFGMLLAQAESPEEIDSNDAIIAARRTIEYFSISSTSLLNVTEQCLAQWEEDAVFTNVDGSGIAEVNVTRLEQSLQECAESYFPAIQQFQEVSANNSATASQSLSFNWNRCWPLLGQTQLIFFPTTDMIEAAHPDSQAEYFEQEWDKMQQELFQEYLPANATDAEIDEAFFRSIDEATGANTCEENMGGTAWWVE
jgi:hypothetical protein